MSIKDDNNKEIDVALQDWADRRNDAKHNIASIKSNLNSIRSCGVLTYKELRTLSAIEKRISDFLKLWKHRHTESKNKFIHRTIIRPYENKRRIDEDDPMHDYNLEGR